MECAELRQHAIINGQITLAHQHAAMALPMLPGYSFPDPSKQDFKKTSTFGFKNGNVINNTRLDSTLQYDSADYAELPPITLLGPSTMTRSVKQEVKIDPYVPADVKYYKLVLKFDGFWKETIGREQHDRGAVIHYFLEDDTIQVVEPRIPNSGIQQGILLRRQKIPIDSSLANTTPYQTLQNATNNTFARSSPTMTRRLPNETGVVKSSKGGVRDPNNYIGSLSNNSPPPSRGSPTFSRSSPTLTRTGSPSSPTNYNTTDYNSKSQTTSTFYGWQDLAVANTVTFFGREYYLVDADQFTRDFYRDQGIELQPAEELPTVLTDTRVVPNTRLLSHDAKPLEERFQLKKFLDNDRKVLKFYCIWDDKSAGYVERRPFILHYFLVDDCVELREVLGPNSGRDPSASFMKKQRLPKKPTSLSEMKTAEHYTDADLSVGMTISVFGREFLIYDADPFTREYYAERYGVTEFPYVQVTEQAREVVKRDIPEYTGFGSEEDSLANCLSLIPKAPKKIPKSTQYGASDVMRFTAQLEGGKKGDEERRFTLSFFLEDDSIGVFENPIRGIRGGKFLERRKMKNPKSGNFYDPLEFFVGAVVDVNAHKFRLLEADAFSSQFYQDHEEEYMEAALARVVEDVKAASATLKPGMLRRVLAASPTATPGAFRQGLNRAGLNLDEPTLAALCRYFQSPDRDVIEVSSFLRAMEI